MDRFRAALLGVMAGTCAVAAAPTTRITVAGLARPAEIRIDRWGVPHITARNRRDAFLAQGFNAARDRLWQIDLWRKHGLGLLAADLGEGYVEQDRASRLFLFRGDLTAEWAAYGPEGKSTLEAFVAGVNAYVDLVLAGQVKLPLEFRILGTRPARWKSEDLLRIRSHGLTGNLVQEVARARTLCAGGEEAEALRQRLEPDWRVLRPEGIDVCSIPQEVLRPYFLARAEPAFPARAAAAASLLDEALNLPRFASNNFAVSGARSATGHPILANDPHREYRIPSLRYLVHLSAPGLELEGAGEPMMPGVSLGHNGHIAVGLTVHGLDQEDLYVYETRSGDPASYRYGQGWERMQTVEEEIAVKGAGPRKVQLRFTRHGPVLYEDPGYRRAYALRAAWLGTGMVPYLRSLAYMDARTWPDFLKALKGHGLPGLNYLYADRAGTIGLAASGFVPKRPNWDGLLPVPGDGRYEWNGVMDGDSLPRWTNPPEGWLASANEMNFPKDYPFAERKTGFEWADRFRADRLREALESPGVFTLEDLRALQCDTLSLPALRLQRILDPPTEKDSSQVAAAVKMLRAWDGKVDADSAAAALFEVWFHRHLRPAVLAALLPRSARAYAGEGDMTRVLEALERPDPRLGGGRRKLLRESLGAAWEELKGRLGPDPARWQWGNLLQARFVHPLSARGSAAERASLNAGPARRGGSRETVGRSGFKSGDFRLELGASVKLILDTGNWDRSLATNAPGQSGDPEDAHYRDLLEDWAADRYFPLLHSRKAIRKATTRIIRLAPATGK